MKIDNVSLTEHIIQSVNNDLAIDRSSPFYPESLCLLLNKIPVEVPYTVSKVAGAGVCRRIILLKSGTLVQGVRVGGVVEAP